MSPTSRGGDRPPGADPAGLRCIGTGGEDGTMGRDRRHLGLPPGEEAVVSVPVG